MIPRQQKLTSINYIKHKIFMHHLSCIKSHAESSREWCGIGVPGSFLWKPESHTEWDKNN